LCWPIDRERRLLPNPGEERNVNVAEREYFQKAMKGRHPFRRHQEQNSGNPVFCDRGARAGSGCAVGVLLGALDIKYFTRLFVESVKIGKGGYAFITDRSGTICSHSRSPPGPDKDPGGFPRLALKSWPGATALSPTRTRGVP